MQPTPATTSSTPQPAAANVVPAAAPANANPAPTEYTNPLNRVFQAACTALTATRDKGEGYVRAQPLKSIAIVASVAALIGILFSRR
jgi:ElaB/YqjD/DUF883 family membrane-anchored ribosome-binding protein